MLKLRFLALSIIISMTLWGCVVELYVKGPSLKVVNQYHQPINEITIFEIMVDGSMIYNYYANLNITEGNSKTFEVYSNNSFEADVEVSFESGYDIKATRFTMGKTTTVTLNENGILE
jgi:hypothetical protein